MTRAFWFTLGLLGAVLVQTALGYVMAGPGRFLDPFLLLVVYAALAAGDTRGMLAGTAAGWVQDVVFGGRVLGLSALSKLTVGYVVGARRRPLPDHDTGARAVAVLVASVRGRAPRPVARLGVRDRRDAARAARLRRAGVRERARRGDPVRGGRAAAAAVVHVRAGEGGR